VANIGQGIDVGDSLNFARCQYPGVFPTNHLHYNTKLNWVQSPREAARNQASAFGGPKKADNRNSE
jgi:hypothetical protein